MHFSFRFRFTVLAHLWPVIGRATVVAKKALLYVFPFGSAAYLWGTLYIDRADRTNATSKLNQESDAIRQNAGKLLLFPEGTRHGEEKLLPFKKGAFHLAIQSQSAIQPVVVTRYYFLDGKRKIFERGELYFSFYLFLFELIDGFVHSSTTLLFDRSCHYSYFTRDFVQRAD